MPTLTLTDDQKEAMRNLRATTSKRWHRDSAAWLLGTHAKTQRVFEELERKGKVLRTEGGGFVPMPHVEDVPAGATPLETMAALEVVQMGQFVLDVTLRQHGGRIVEEAIPVSAPNEATAECMKFAVAHDCFPGVDQVLSVTVRELDLAVYVLTRSRHA